MSTGQKITTQGKNIILERTFSASPSKSEPSLFTVGTGTTSPALSDTDLETPVDIDGDNFKGFVSGYPLLDTTNLQATIRALILSTEANGNNLTEFGIVNTDGTKQLFSRAVHTSIAKTPSIEIAYIEKNKIL